MCGVTNTAAVEPCLDTWDVFRYIFLASLRLSVSPPSFWQPLSWGSHIALWTVPPMHEMVSYLKHFSHQLGVLHLKKFSAISCSNLKVWGEVSMAHSTAHFAMRSFLLVWKTNGYDNNSLSDRCSTWIRRCPCAEYAMERRRVKAFSSCGAPHRQVKVREVVEDFLLNPRRVCYRFWLCWLWWFEGYGYFGCNRVRKVSASSNFSFVFYFVYTFYFYVCTIPNGFCGAVLIV